MSKQDYQKVFLHLVKTKRAFCFGTSGAFYSLDDVMTKLYGREVSLDEALELISK